MAASQAQVQKVALRFCCHQRPLCICFYVPVWQLVGRAPHSASHCPGGPADLYAGPCLATVPLPVPRTVLPGMVRNLSGHIQWWVPSSHQEREQTGFKAVGLCFSPVVDPCCGHSCYRTCSGNADRPPHCEEG